MSARILVGDNRASLRTLDAGSVHTCVTSPPYWGLRDYGHEGQIGLEGSPAEYVAALVEVFREVRRVLRDDGTLWLNLGDSYAGSWGAQSRADTTDANDMRSTLEGSSTLSARQMVAHPHTTQTGSLKRTPGLKNKDLMGMPWRVAFALQDDGWYLRSDIIWAKPNPMPESVTDRPTKAHEYLFLLSKSERYAYDAAAIREPHSTPEGQRHSKQGAHPLRGQEAIRPRGSVETEQADRYYHESGRNRRTVWTIATQPYSGAHFAMMPPALVEPCVKAGSPIGGLVLDPFGGAGTVGMVARRLQRRAVLCELNPDYAELARRRIEDDAPLLNGAA